MKTCRVCLAAKPLDAFYQSKSACRICLCAKEKRRRLEKGDEIRAKARARNAANPEANRTRVKAWVAANPERRRRNALAYARRNMDKIKKWTRENPERLREGKRRNQAIRKARQCGNGGNVTRTGWLTVVASSGGKCVYCLADCRITVDHFIPIRHGGQTIKGNLLPSCQRCNSQKGDREPRSWVEAQFGAPALARVLSLLAAA